MTSLYHQGLSVDQVGRELGVASITVSRRLRKAGVEMRSPGRRRMLVSDEEILRLRGEGMTWQEVADRVGMTINGVHARWRKMRDACGLVDPMPAGQRPRRPRPWSSTLQRTVELYGSGMTVHEVGNAMGVEGITVSRRLKAAGVKARKPGVRLPVDDMQILELRGRGMLWREVAVEVGMTATGVRSRFYALRADGYEDPMPPRD